MFLSSPSTLVPPKRIVSLVPSQTELLHWLGLDEEIVGITKFCIFPQEWHRNKLRVGGTKTVDIQKILNLNPDLIIANKEENSKEQVEILATRFPLWVTDVNQLDDAIQMIDDIGKLTGKIHRASLLTAQIQSEFEKLPSTRLAFNDSKNSPVPTAYLIWKDPYMAIGSGTFINDMLQRAGFENIFSRKQRYPEITISEIQETNCKIVLLSSEPYPFKQKNVEELQALLPGIKIVLADGEMFSWYGNRLLKAPGYFISLMNKVKRLIS